MATVHSDQVTKLDVNKPAELLDPTELKGRYRTAYWTYTVPAGGQAVSDILRAAKLPKDARIMDWAMVWDALSSGAGTSGADVGLDSALTRYETALDMDAAGSKRADLAIDVIPEGTKLPNEPTYFTLRVTGEAWAAAAKIQGWITYVLD